MMAQGQSDSAQFILIQHEILHNKERKKLFPFLYSTFRFRMTRSLLPALCFLSHTLVLLAALRLPPFPPRGYPEDPTECKWQWVITNADFTKPINHRLS